MEMTLVMKSKNVCLLYLPVISRGKHCGGTRIDNTLTNITKKKKRKNDFKKGEKKYKTLMKNNPFESKELPEPESGDVIPVYSGYEIPSFSLPLSFSLSLTISFSPSVSFSIYLCCFYQCIL